MFLPQSVLFQDKVYTTQEILGIALPYQHCVNQSVGAARSDVKYSGEHHGLG